MPNAKIIKAISSQAKQERGGYLNKCSTKRFNELVTVESSPFSYVNVTFVEHACGKKAELHDRPQRSREGK